MCSKVKSNAFFSLSYIHSLTCRSKDNICDDDVESAEERCQNGYIKTPDAVHLYKEEIENYRRLFSAVNVPYTELGVGESIGQGIIQIEQSHRMLWFVIIIKY